MINILSYIGMSAQSELCLWTLLGLLRTIFDATLFKVNANLKQVWQMTMPSELSLPVQRVLRTMISGVMLVQCFSVYVYLASYIVLLYPVFLEERPTLVLPWLLLAAIRNFLCELTSLALGLGTCVLLGAARPPCIKFLITKLATIMPSFYMWMLIFSYYHNLKMATAFKTFPAVSPAYNLDYGLELAVRRRRTKSLQDENQLRKKLIASLYHENLVTKEIVPPNLAAIDETEIKSEDSSTENLKASLDVVYPLAVTTRTMSDIGTYEDWFGSEVVVPRDTDRILEQFVLMLMRIGAFLKKDDSNLEKFISSNSQGLLPPTGKRLECTTIPTEDVDTNPIVGNSKGRVASYLIDYPDIFMRKPSDLLGSYNLNEHKTLDTNNKLLDINSLSSGSNSTKEVSLNTVSLTSENKEFQPVSGQQIYSNQDVDDPSVNDKKYIEHLLGSSLELTQPAEVKTESSENIKNIINRMKVRASMPLEKKSHESTSSTRKPLNKDSLPMTSQRKKTVSIKNKSKESLLKKKRKEQEDK